MSNLLGDAKGKGREKFIRGIKKYGFGISVASYFIGLLWMLLLPHHELSARNYFSENQLLPGLVDTNFPLNHYTQRVFRKLRDHCLNDESSTKDLMKDVFNEFGLDVYQQRFKVPLKFINGSNLYGIFRASRASGVESVILNVPLHANCSSSGALALMLGISNYFSDQTYWAKDIIFLVTEHGLYGMQAWLNGYFHDKTEGIDAEFLRGSGGSIQAALTIDFPADYVNYVDILFQGSNGLLPNLDFIHLVYRIANTEHVPSKFMHQSDLFSYKEEYPKNLETLIHMIATQASGYPTGNHGLFYKYRIEAVTLRGMKGKYDKPVGFDSLGRMVEGIFRSMNNMLEHFHQSFFLYVLPNNYMYISIGMYMPPLGCLLLPLVIKLVLLWITIFQLDHDGEGMKKDLVTLSALFDGHVVQHIIVSHVLSFSCYYGLHSYISSTAYEDIGNQHFFAAVVVTCCSAAILSAIIRHRQPISSYNSQFFATLHLLLFIIVLSVLNFSAAFIVSCFYSPLVIAMSFREKRFWKVLRLLLNLLASPPIVIYVLCALSMVFFENFNVTVVFMREILHKWRMVFTEAHLNHFPMIWTKDLCYFALLPIWISISSIDV